MNKPDIELADMLASAREYIESHGWWRGGFIGPNGRQVCGMAAILMSQGCNPNAEVVWIKNRRFCEVAHAVVQAAIDMDAADCNTKLLMEHAETKTSFSVGAFEHWNDHVVKNKQTLLDCFAKAEKIARAGFDPDAT